MNTSDFKKQKFRLRYIVRLNIAIVILISLLLYSIECGETNLLYSLIKYYIK